MLFSFQVGVLACEQFNTESGYDYVRVYEADGSLIGAYSGSATGPFVVAGRSNGISVDWSSDGSVVSRGFSCQFSSGWLAYQSEFY